MLYFLIGVVVGILISIADVMKHGRDTVVSFRKKVAPQIDKVEIVDMRSEEEVLRDNFNLKP